MTRATATPTAVAGPRWRGPVRLALLAAVPVGVLVVFFVLPVGAMLGRGLWVDGSFDPGAVLDVLARPRVR
ncbi:MAG: iron ABC transporter permease, partial [Actinobacteria bacterium]|nr:iron ABC transporter permease [Actinomycetota bacterium]